MKCTPDTNVLVRAALEDDPVQARAARKLLREAEHVALTLPALCEFVWVLRSGYRLGGSETLAALHQLLQSQNVIVDRPAIAAGISVLQAGGDFADGVIAHEGTWMGGETFVSFDRKAVALLTKQRRAAQLLR